MAQLTPEEEAELQALGQELGLSPDEEAELAMLESDPDVQASLQKEPSLGAKALDYGARALDYLGGQARAQLIQPLVTGAELGAAGAKYLQGDGAPEDFLAPLLRAEETKQKAIVGKAPTTSEMLESAGVPEMGKLSDVAPGLYSETGEGLPLQKGGWADPTARGTLGFAADMIVDPTTYATGGLSIPGKLAKGATVVSQPLSAGLKGLGKQFYKSAFSEVDAVARNYGKKMLPSEILWEGGEALTKGGNKVSTGLKKTAQTIFGPQVTGTAGGVLQKATKIADDLMDKRNEIIKLTEEKGVLGSMNKALEPVEKMIETWKKSGNNKRKVAAEAFETEVAAQKALGEAGGVAPSLETILDIKSTAYSGVGKKAYEMGADPSLLKKLSKKMGSGFREESERVAGLVGKEADLKTINKKLGTLLTPQETMKKQARISSRKRAITPLDLVAQVADSSGALLSAKKLGDLGMTTIGRTVGGKLLHRFGETGAPIAQRGILNRFKENEE